jgi:hypothetical protein
LRPSITILFLILLAASRLCGQTGTVAGRVYDQSDHTPIVGANILLINSNDSLERKAVTSDAKGGFVFRQLKTGQYSIILNYLGYKKLNRTVNVANGETNLGTLGMVPDSNGLQGVEVVGHVPPVVQHGDTVQYNADSYATNPDAELEDLLYKLPGISIDNGTVKAQGEEIAQILLDGKPYFGGDLNAALKNIPAETIDKVQVYYKRSDQAKFTGIDDGQSVKIINIITKKDKRNGQFGKAHGGYGSGGHYAADGNLNFFKGNRRASVVGASSNGISAAQGGISATGSAGISYGDSIGKTTYFTGSYGYGNSINNVQSSLTRTYFGTNTAYSEMDVAGTANASHRINLKVETNFDTLNNLVFTPAVNILSNNGNNAMHAANQLNGVPENQTQNAGSNINMGYNASANLLYGHKFKKLGRTLSLNFNANINNNTTTGDLHTLSTYYGNHDSSVAFNQKNSSLANNYFISPSLSCTEPLNKSSLLQFTVSTSVNSSRSNKTVNNFDSAIQEYSRLDTALSNNFTTRIVTNKAGIGYQLHKKKYNLIVSINYNNTGLDGNEDYPLHFKIHKIFNSFLPSAIFNYKFSSKSNLSINYQTSAGLPSVFQLQAIVNNINPLQVSIGNPALEQQYNQSIGARFGFPVSSVNSVFINFNAATTAHLIANSIVTATRDSVLSGGYLMKKGAQLTKPVNLEGNYSARANTTYAIPLQKIKTNLNLNAGCAYSTVPGLINYSPVFVNTFAINGAVGLSSNFKDHLDYSVNYSPAYNIVQNTLQKQQNNNYYYQNLQCRVNWIILKGFVLNTDFNYHQYIGLAAAYNQDYLSWNASLGKKFFKKQNGELRVYVYDILDQNSNVSHTVTDVYVQDRQANRLGRYYMVSFVYQLKNYTP